MTQDTLYKKLAHGLIMNNYEDVGLRSQIITPKTLRVVRVAKVVCQVV